MLEYRCPDCNRKLFEASGQVTVRVEIFCKSKQCRAVVQPIGLRPRHITYACSECGKINHAENPKQDMAYCIPCGKNSMIPVPAVDRSRAGAYVPN